MQLTGKRYSLTIVETISMELACMVSERLRAAVKVSRVRQYQLANAIGVNHSTLSAWLNGIARVKPGDARIVQLGALVGVPAGECFE